MPEILIERNSLCYLFNEERRRFPVLAHKVYLQSASTGLIPDYVYNSVEKYQKDRYLNGGDSSWDGKNTFVMMEGAKDSLAHMLNCKKEDIFFGLNSSALLNLFVQGLNLQPHENVLLSYETFISGRYAWQYAARKGFQLRYLRPKTGMLQPEEIFNAADENTRVIFLCFVESDTGFRYDLNAIGNYCRERGILLAVDAVQGVGVLPLDVTRMNIDFLVGNDYKWMMHYCGTGFACISQALRSKLYAQGAGWMSDIKRSDTHKKEFIQRDDAGKYEMGYPNAAGIYALGLVADRYMELGVVRIEQYILSLVEYLYQKANQTEGIRLVYAFPVHNRSGIVYLAIPAKRRITEETLAAKGVMIDGHIYNQEYVIRVSLHYYNDRSDIDRLLEVIG